VLFVGLGYRMEQRSYVRVSGGYAGGWQFLGLIVPHF